MNIFEISVDLVSKKERLMPDSLRPIADETRIYKNYLGDCAKDAIQAALVDFLNQDEIPLSPSEIKPDATVTKGPTSYYFDIDDYGEWGLCQIRIIVHEYSFVIGA